MSGPIVRKYGFPNFEKIFGDRGLQHGVDEEAKPSDTSAEKGASEASSNPAAAGKANDEGKKSAR